jgi:hypothetical protein
VTKCTEDRLAIRPGELVESHAIRTSAACFRAFARQIPAHFGLRAALPSPRRDQSWQPFSARSLVDRHYCGEQSSRSGPRPELLHSFPTVSAALGSIRLLCHSRRTTELQTAR